MAMNSTEKQKKKLTEKQKKKKKLVDRDGLSCRWCKKLQLEDQLTLEHLRPKSKGGSDRLINLCLACPKCNQERGDKPFPPGYPPTWKDIFQLVFLFIFDHRLIEPPSFMTWIEQFQI